MGSSLRTSGGVAPKQKNSLLGFHCWNLKGFYIEIRAWWGLVFSHGNKASVSLKHPMWGVCFCYHRSRMWLAMTPWVTASSRRMGRRSGTYLTTVWDSWLRQAPCCPRIETARCAGPSRTMPTPAMCPGHGRTASELPSDPRPRHTPQGANASGGEYCGPLCLCDLWLPSQRRVYLLDGEPQQPPGQLLCCRL